MVEQTVCYEGVTYQLMEEPVHKLDDLEYVRVFHYYDVPLTFTMRAKDTGQLYFFNYVDYSDGWNLYIQVPITEDAYNRFVNGELTINGLLRGVEGQAVHYILSGGNTLQYLKREVGIPQAHYTEREDCYITDEDDYTLY